MSVVEPVVRIDNDEVRVSEYRFGPGDETGHHRHGYDYVVIPLTPGLLKLYGAGGETQAELAPGIAYFRKAGVEHNVINGGGAPLAFVEVELKDHPG
ncbi:MAG TPA: cupin domain-containing protein [Steroidobacteraceae bacterium]|jgi:quercetin dioxygenase-like cupin family protein